MAHAEGAWHFQAHRRQVERKGQRRVAWHILIIGDVAPGKEPTGCLQSIEKTEALQFDDAPGGDKFTAHLVGWHDVALQYGDGNPSPGQDCRQGATGDTSADNDDIICFGHEASGCFNTVSGKKNSSRPTIFARSSGQKGVSSDPSRLIVQRVFIEGHAPVLSFVDSSTPTHPTEDNVCCWHETAVENRAEHVCSARVLQTSTCSAIARASSTSMPRYLTVLSIFVCPRRS